VFDIIFPQKLTQRYWNIHYLYVLSIFQYLGCTISFKEGLDFDNTSFRCFINGKEFLFDFADSSEIKKCDLKTFKFHCHQETDQIKCFPPVSFYNWWEYIDLEKEIIYNPNSSLHISCRQRPYGGAIERRKFVQNLLVKDFPNRVWVNIIPQEDYWKEISRINVAVFVPGFCNNMLDRGHLQYMAFGCYTLSPNIPEILPFNKKVLPGIHYSKCSNNYMDLTSLIWGKYLNSNQNRYFEIGLNAKKLFKETCTPKAIGEWIGVNL
jgi:hypothetical protein